MGDRAKHDVWNRHATRWDHIGPPLRPCAADVRVFERAVADTPCRHALLLGVTPELAGMRWPAGTSLLACDRSRSMLENRAHGNAACGDWQQLPLADASCDVAIGDGCFPFFPYPDSVRLVLRELHRVLRPGGMFVTRAFVRPEVRESREQVYGDLEAGRIGNFHVLKFRLAMALQRDTASGVRTGDVWTDWSESGYTAGRFGWPDAQVATIDSYRGQDTVYHFPTLEVLRALVADAGFDEIDCTQLDYEMADRCPILTLRRRGR